ncbi:MAG: outer membrane beta-barrel protein [Desulfobacterales bacterium]|nr:outer membrane beta-barrel protein [Desulfobacterales bacterium]
MKNKTDAVLIVIAFILAALSFPTKGFAEGNINLKPMTSASSKTESYRKGKITVRPLITVSSRVDSNFYKSETNKKDVYTYLIKPGILLGYSTAKSSISLKYTLDAHFYKNQHGSDTPEAEVDDYVGHTAILTAETQPFDRLSMGLENSFHKTRDSAKLNDIGEQTGRAKYTINRLTPSIFYEFENKFSAGFRYRNTITDYSNENLEDSTENRGMFDLIYNFSPRSSIDLEYQVWQRDYDLLTSDYTSNQVKLILKKQFNYFSFEAGAGYHNRSFDQNSLNDTDVVSYRFAVTGQNPPFPESKPKSYITLAAERNFNDSGTGNNYYTANDFSLEIGRRFQGKLLINLKGSYKISNYENITGLDSETREDDYYRISTGLSYEYSPQAILALILGHESRDSNLAEDYDNTFFQVSLDYSYNLMGPKEIDEEEL